MVAPESAGPDPRRVRTAADLTRELDLLRRRAAQGARRVRLSLDELSQRTGIPRSTVHSYIRGVRLPPPDSLDDLVIAMGAVPAEQHEWAEALFRITSEQFPPAEAAEPVEPLRPGLPVPRQLPAAPRDLVGREAELAQLSDLLTTARADSRAPLVVGIAGTGGIGKTALALRCAHDAAEHFPDGQLWVDLRGYGPGTPLSPSDALEQLLRGVGVSTSELSVDVETRAATFRSAVAGKRLLILLDNARESAQVLPLLPGAAGCVTIVTSRTALRSLVVLGVADTISLDRLPASIARSLIQPGAITSTELTERIARHCGGLPLALRIMRERLSRATAEEMERFADELDRDDRARLAALELSDAGSEVSVRGALRWSYEALQPAAAAMFRRLPLCWQSSFERRTAAAVHGVSETESGRLLDLLVDASLLDTAGPQRYRVHDLVLAYAAECMRRDEPAAEQALGRRRSLGYLLDIAEAAVATWDPSRPFRIPRPAGLDSGAPVSPEWALGHVDAFALAITEAIKADQAAAAWALGERSARAIRPLADMGVLESAMRTAVASAMAAENALAVAVLLRHLGVNHGRRGELDEADLAFGTAIEWARRADLPRLVAMDLSNQAFVWVMRGDVAAGRRVMAEQVPVLRELGESSLASLLSLADLDLEQGDIASAADWSEQGMAELAAAGLQTGALAIEVRLTRAQVDCALGRYDAALDLLATVEAMSQDSGNSEYLPQAHLIRATVERDRGQFRPAEESARIAVEIATQFGDRRAETSALNVLGDVARRSGRPAEAVEVLTAALERAEQAGLRHVMAQLLVSLALAQRDLGQPASAVRSAERARTLAQDCGFATVLGQAETVLAEF